MGGASIVLGQFSVQKFAFAEDVDRPEQDVDSDSMDDGDAFFDIVGCHGHVQLRPEDEVETRRAEMCCPRYRVAGAESDVGVRRDLADRAWGRGRRPRMDL